MDGRPALWSGWTSALITQSSAVLHLSLTTPTFPLSPCCLYIGMSLVRGRRQPAVYDSEQVCIRWHRTGACYTDKLTFSHSSAIKVWGVYYTNVRIIFKFLWHRLSCTVSKLLLIIGSEKGMPHFNVFAGDDPLPISLKTRFFGPTFMLQKVLVYLQPLLRNLPKKRRNSARAITPLKVIQGHLVWYQSKAHIMRLPISD